MDMYGKEAPVTFRPMTVEDVPRVHEIDVLSFSLPWSERSFRFEVTENKHSVVWVAEVPGSQGESLIVAVIVVWAVLDEAHIATIATHPHYRGARIGQRLLAHAMLAAYQRGARSAYLEVRRSNQAAQALYIKFGFTVVGVRSRYYKDNYEDALLMTLEHMQPEALQQFLQEPSST